MKKLYKRLLAIVLCLALATAIVPVTAFAKINYDRIEGHRSGDPVPGEVLILLNEQYYTYGGPYLELREILPEIEIERYRDLALSPILNGNIPEEELDDITLARIGTEFVIKLTEKTVEAGARAVELLKNNPYIKSVGPNRYANACVDYETTIIDALDVLRVSAGLVEATEEVVDAYDLDFDGKVTAADALIVLRLAAGLL